MVLRAVLGVIGDVQQLLSGDSGALTHTARRGRTTNERPR